MMIIFLIGLGAFMLLGFFAGYCVENLGGPPDFLDQFFFAKSIKLFKDSAGAYVQKVV